MNETSVAAMAIREAIEVFDSSRNDSAVEEENLEVEGPDMLHVSVGSPLPPTVLSQVEHLHSNDPAFSGLRKKVNATLRNIIANNDEPANKRVYPATNEDLQVAIFCRIISMLLYTYMLE